jgi:bifunctional DNase/RNase
MEGYVEAQVSSCDLACSCGCTFRLQLQEKRGKRVIDMRIDSITAQGIVTTMTEGVPKRPLTHDLITSIVKEMGLSLESVAVTNLDGDTFFAALFFKKGEGETVKIDSRSSDAVAVGLKCGVPILVAEQAFEQSDLARREPEGSA